MGSAAAHALRDQRGNQSTSIEYQTHHRSQSKTKSKFQKDCRDPAWATTESKERRGWILNVHRRNPSLFLNENTAYVVRIDHSCVRIPIRLKKGEQKRRKFARNRRHFHRTVDYTHNRPRNKIAIYPCKVLVDRKKKSNKGERAQKAERRARDRQIKRERERVREQGNEDRGGAMATQGTTKLVSALSESKSHVGPYRLRLYFIA